MLSAALRGSEELKHTALLECFSLLSSISMYEGGSDETHLHVWPYCLPQGIAEEVLISIGYQGCGSGSRSTPGSFLQRGSMADVSV